MNYTVPTASIICMAIAALAGVAIPVTLFFVGRRKYKADIAPFLIGCAVFIVFALLVEGAINRFIFASNAGKAIQSNFWLYGIFGGLMAGLFEETGRYVAFKTVLKKKRFKDQNALMYGAGHGGFEAFYILVFSMVSYISMAMTLNAGMTEKLTAGVTDAATLQALHATFAALTTTAPALYLLSIIERFSAVALHMALTVLVWFAAKEGRKCFWLYPLALLLHALVDAVAVILHHYIPNVWIIVGVVYVMVIGCAMIAFMVWKKHSKKANDMPQNGILNPE